jgi:hypothetical protein
VDVRRVLSSELENVDGVPDDMVLAHGLKPKSLDTQRAAPHFRMDRTAIRREGDA